MSEQKWQDIFKRKAHQLALQWREEQDIYCRPFAARFYLFFRTSNQETGQTAAVTIARTSPGEGWQRITPQHIYPSWPVEIVEGWILAMMWLAPIIDLDPEVVVYRGYLSPSPNAPTLITLATCEYKIEINHLDQTFLSSKTPSEKRFRHITMLKRDTDGPAGARFIMAVRRAAAILKTWGLEL